MRGTTRVLRALHSPQSRTTPHFDGVVSYDDGLMIHVNTASHIEWYIFFYGYYEPEIVELLSRLTRPGFVAIDVGANIGCHSLVMARRVGGTGRVLAVEPNPLVRERLRSNVSLNRLENVELECCALSDSVGSAILHRPQQHTSNQGTASLHLARTLEGAVLEPVECLTLDELVRRTKLARVDVIKIDTEGNDLGVLLGAEQTIRSCRPHIVFEFDEAYWHASGSMFSTAEALFRRMNYRLYSIKGRQLAPIRSDMPPSANILAVPQL